MSGNESATDWSEPSAVESEACRIRRNDMSLTEIQIHVWQSDALEILDALKNNLVVKKFDFDADTGTQLNQALVKLSEVMKGNKSVESLTICLESVLLEERDQVFAVMATHGGWSSIQELELSDDIEFEEPLSLREAEHISSFIVQSENIRTLSLKGLGDEDIEPIMETLSRTKVQSLKICFCKPIFTLHNRGQNRRGRRLATALERCTCITELQLELQSYNDRVEFFQILFVESIPKMLGLKKFELRINRRYDQRFFDMVGHCIGGHQGELEELRLICSSSSSVNSSSIVGLAPALKRLKVIRLDGFYAPLTLQEMGKLSDVAAGCGALEEFGYNLVRLSQEMSTEAFKAICQFVSKFPSLKQVTQQDQSYAGDVLVDLCEESRFVAFLEMVKTSKTIEQVPLFRCRNAEEEAAVKHHCRNNSMHNQIELIRENGLLAATVSSSAWPLILKEFSDMPDVLYYLLQQKHGAMVGPTT